MNSFMSQHLSSTQQTLVSMIPLCSEEGFYKNQRAHFAVMHGFC